MHQHDGSISRRKQRMQLKQHLNNSRHVLAMYEYTKILGKDCRIKSAQKEGSSQSHASQATR